MTPITALLNAADTLGGREQLAQAIGVSKSAPGMWIFRGRIPAEHCPAIEEAVRNAGGNVRCEDLCPDVKWHVLRSGPARIRANRKSA